LTSLRPIELLPVHPQTLFKLAIFTKEQRRTYLARRPINKYPYQVLKPSQIAQQRIAADFKTAPNLTISDYTRHTTQSHNPAA